MWIEQLQLQSFRCFNTVDITLSKKTNLFIGANGAGKTALVEAIFLLSYGRSFRPYAKDALIRNGDQSFTIFSLLHHKSNVDRLGVSRTDKGIWRGRLNDAILPRISELFQTCAVCCFEPESHELIFGSSEHRRRFMDWGLFHVEHQFLKKWREYQRALKQRNALLKQQAADQEFLSWELIMASTGVWITQQRQRYLSDLAKIFDKTLQNCWPEAGKADLYFSSGHESKTEIEFTYELEKNRAHDRRRQITRKGPHRADWTPTFENLPAISHLSRGQGKLTALSAILAQAQHYQKQHAEWPIIILDDLPSELDFKHQKWVLQFLQENSAQVLITTTEITPPLEEKLSKCKLFHVEQGNIL